MGRPKGDSTKPFSCRMSCEIYDQLDRFCENTGISKTKVAEKAIEQYIQEYERKQKLIDEINKK